MKHILFINPNKDTFTNPTLVTLFEQLSALSGVRVSLLAQEQIVAAPSHLEKIKQVYFPVFAVTWSKKVWSWFPKMKANRRLKEFCKKEEVSTLIAIDPLGLIIGGRVKKRNPNMQLHYLSFEIFFRDELGAFPYYQKIKQKEIAYSRFIDCLVIQDEERRDLLLRENKISSDKHCFLLPVSPSAAEIDQTARKKWREKLGIPEDQTVLVHSGSLERWSGGESLLEILRTGIPANCLLLIHSKEKLHVSNPVHRKLLDFQAKGYPLLIHDTTFENYGDYLSFLQVADLALALYQPDTSSPYTGKNIAHIGLASGKFSCYMNQGLPTIVSSSAAYHKLVGEYDFGFVLDETKRISGILVSLSREALTHKRKEALRLYNEILDPGKTSKDYVRYLHEN